MTYQVASGTGFFAGIGTGHAQALGHTVFRLQRFRDFDMTATAPVARTTGPTTPPPVQTTIGPSWHGQGRFTVATNRTTNVRAFSLQGTADFGSSGFFAIAGTLQTVGNVASGHATGRITLTDRRGTLVLSLTGPTQTRNAGLPTSFSYKVVSGTGFFAHYVGKGRFSPPQCFSRGMTTRGNSTSRSNQRRSDWTSVVEVGSLRLQ